MVTLINEIMNLKRAKNYFSQLRGVLLFFLNQVQLVIGSLEQLYSKDKQFNFIKKHLEYCKSFVDPHNLKHLASQLPLYQLLLNYQLSLEFMENCDYNNGKKNEFSESEQQDIIPNVRISQIQVLINNIIDQIQRMLHLNAKQVVELQDFYFKQIHKSIKFQLSQTRIFITTQIDILKNKQKIDILKSKQQIDILKNKQEIDILKNQLLEYNKFHFQRFIFFQFDHLNELLNLLFNRFHLFSPYLQHRFQFLFIDIGTRIQIMNHIHFQTFEDTIHLHQALNPYADIDLDLFNDEIVFSA